jgi:ADP-heptose:LPS heptosyltransferase
MSTPMLEALREALPQASIEFLCYDAFAPALKGHPACDRVHTMPPKAGRSVTLSTARSLRQREFDWCFDTLGNPRSALLMKLIAPRHSVGPAALIRGRLYEHQLKQHPEDKSMLRYYLDLLGPLLGRVEDRPTSLRVEESEREDVAARLDIEPGTELVLIHPGATHADRAWPVERWPELISGLQARRSGTRIRVITQPDWEDVADEVVRGCSGDVSRLPVLDLRSLIALLTRSSLYVGNDGGILHCAVALRVPAVGIFGPTDPAEWFTYSGWGPYRVVHSFSNERRRFRGRRERGFPNVRVEEALAAVDEVISVAPSR